MIVHERPDQQQSGEADREQTRPALPAGSIYSDEERIILVPCQDIRQQLLNPLALLLSRLGISADMLSYASVFFGLGFCLLGPFQFEIAFWLLMASVVCDGLDGVEARFTGTNTTRGSFTDVCCDLTVVALSVAGVAWKGLIHPVLAVLFVYCYTALAIFLVLHRMLHVSSVGILRPSRMVFFAAIVFYYVFQINLLNILLVLYLAALPLLVLSFWRLRKSL